MVFVSQKDFVSLPVIKLLNIRFQDHIYLEQITTQSIKNGKLTTKPKRGKPGP